MRQEIKTTGMMSVALHVHNVMGKGGTTVRVMNKDEARALYTQLGKAIAEVESADVRAKSPEFVSAWDVYRYEDGTPVTIDTEQLHAIWHAINVVDQVRRSEAHDDTPILLMGTSPSECSKSRLLGRMLLDGKPPTKTKPPTLFGGPAWHQLPEGDPF